MEQLKVEGTSSCYLVQLKQGCHKQDTQDSVLISPWMEIPLMSWPALFQCHHHCAQANCSSASSSLCLKLKSSAQENQQQLQWLVYTYWSLSTTLLSFSPSFSLVFDIENSALVQLLAHSAHLGSHQLADNCGALNFITKYTAFELIEI